VLFYDSATGRGVVGFFDSSGTFQQEWTTTQFTHNWSTIVSTWAGDLFFYNKTSGAARHGKIARSGAFVDGGAINGIIAGWDQIVPTGNCNLFFYRSADGYAALAQLLDGGFRTITTQSLSANRLASACANGGLLLLNSISGEARSGAFSEAGRQGLRDFPIKAFTPGWQMAGAVL
jgi:hypothetical protein